MEIKIYYSSKDYLTKYNSEFLKWNEIITEGEEKHFLNYQLQLYKNIEKIIENQISITKNLVLDGEDDVERLTSEYVYFRYILKHQSYKDFLKYNSNNEILIILFKRFYNIQGEEWQFDEIGFGNFRLAVTKILDYINTTINSIKLITNEKKIESFTAGDTIKLKLTPTQIVYLFQEIEKKFGDKTHNTKYWKFISDFFIDKDGQELKNIHQTKFNLNDTKTAKPKQHSDSIDAIIQATKDIEKPL